MDQLRSRLQIPVLRPRKRQPLLLQITLGLPPRLPRQHRDDRREHRHAR